MPGTMDMISLAQLFARLFTDASAPSLLERAGLPIGKFPPWGNLTPEAYWETVLRELEKGVVAGGFDALLTEARRAYPGNADLLEVELEVPDGTRRGGVSTASTAGARGREISVGGDLTAGQVTVDVPGPDFHVFLAHNTKDKARVLELGEALRARGLRVWLDAWNLKPGDAWQDVLAEILQTTGSAAVLLGADGAGPWQRLEIQGALAEFVERGMPVIPVLLPGAPDDLKLPYFLKGFAWSDLRGGFTKEGLDHLQWGITGKKPEDPSSPPPTLDLAPWLRHVHAAHGGLTPTLGRRVPTALSHIYVELRIAEREHMEHWRAECRAGEKVAAPDGRRSLKDVLRLDPDVDGSWITRRWLLYGDPGSGKTTLLRHLAATLSDPERAEPAPWIPVFESLPRFLREHEGDVYYPAALASRIHAVAGGDAEAWHGELDALAAAGRLLLLFDGLDEVPATDHGRVDALLSGVASRSGWERTPIVVTSRPIGGHSPGSSFKHLEILPFGDGDRREFLSRWLGGEGEPDTAGADAALARFRRDPSVWELAGNPLYLTLLAMLFGDKVEIPERRSELYSKIFEFLLEGRHRGSDPIEHEWAVETALRDLAWTMTHEGLDAEPRRALVRRIDQSAVAKEALSCAEEWKKSPRRFLDAVATKTSILGAHDGQHEDWRYWHRTFREALAAERLDELRQSEGEEALIAHARERTDEDAGRWAEPYALLAGRLPKPDALILTLVEENQALGLRALATAQGLERETIDTILERLREAKDDEDGDAPWQKRARVYRRIPELLADASASLDLLERLRRETSNGNDLFFLELAMAEVAQRWPEARGEAERKRADLFGHLAKPEGFDAVAIPVDGLWRRIPAGTFRMGTAEGEGGHDYERPQHEVVIASDFQMASIPVTNAQYRVFDPSHEPHAFDGVDAAELDDHPVVNVTWYAAVMFCRWLAQRQPGVRLATEEEWEYACRAGTTTRYWSGDSEDDLKRVGWYDGNSGHRTHRVGEKPANAWGLFDVHGNVFEWTQSPSTSDYSDREPGRQVDPSADLAVSPADLAGDAAATPGGWRVIRGGCFWNSADWSRSAYRGRSRPWGRGRGLGFRLVCVLPRPEPEH